MAIPDPASAQQSTPPARKGSGVRLALRWLERSLWALGLVCLSWVGFAWGEAKWYQHRAVGALERQTLVLEGTSAETGPEASGGLSSLPGDPPPFEPSPAAGPDREESPNGAQTQAGAPLARLVIPAAEVDAVVARGIDSRTLRRAVGWIPSTASPESRDGNVGLAGHRDSFFRNLERVRLGDEIRLETPAGIATYRVAWIRVVDPSRVDLLAPTAYPGLTLVTCYPFRWIGPAPERFVVRARAVDEEAASSQLPAASDEASEPELSELSGS